MLTMNRHRKIAHGVILSEAKNLDLGGQILE